MKNTENATLGGNSTTPAVEKAKRSSIGKNRFTIDTDGEQREYFVHVPTGYNGCEAFPVVFMLHGSGGNGERFYNISGWKEVGEEENILTVFPSSFVYPCIFDDGVNKRNAEKWTSYDLEFCGKSEPVDDIKFLSAVIDEMSEIFRIDENRVYLAGFSNGGEMAARCAIELSDRLAAVVACAGSLPTGQTYQPKRKLPVLLQIGNSDAKLLAKLGASEPLPMDFGDLLSDYPLIQDVIDVYLRSFELTNSITEIGNPERYIIAEYTSSCDQENVFRFAVIKNLEHNYPNGKNHPLKGAELHWKWMKNFQLVN